MSKFFFQNRWNGGISNDPNAGLSGCVFDSRGVDVRSDSRCFSLTRNATNEVDLQGIPYFIDAYGNGSAGIVGTSKTWPSVGLLENLAGGLLYTFASGNAWSKDLRNFARFTVTTAGPTVTDTLIFSTRRVHRLNNASPGTVTEDAFDLTNTVEYRPIFVLPSSKILLIGNGDRIASITDAGIVDTAHLVLQAGDVVRAICPVGQYVVIYANDSTGGSASYVWDGVTDSVVQRTPWPDITIVNAIAVWPINYVWWTVGNESFLWVSDGYDKTLITRASYITATDKLAYSGASTNAIEAIGETVVIPGYRNVWRYGNFYPGFPKSATGEWTFGWSWVDKVVSLATTWTKLYYWYETSNDGKIGYKSLDTTSGGVWSTGYVELNPFYWDFEGQKKTAEKIKIGYFLGGTITVSASVDDAAYATIATIDSTGWPTWYGKASINYEGAFHKIKFKIEITGTCKVYDFTLAYNDTENDF